VQSMGAVMVDPNGVVWVGTGEPDMGGGSAPGSNPEFLELRESRMWGFRQGKKGPCGCWRLLTTPWPRRGSNLCAVGAGGRQPARVPLPCLPTSALAIQQRSFAPQGVTVVDAGALRQLCCRGSR
jgi:hypothetical protein